MVSVSLFIVLYRILVIHSHCCSTSDCVPWNAVTTVLNRCVLHIEGIAVTVWAIAMYE